MSTHPHTHSLLSLIGIIPKLCVPCKCFFQSSSVTGSLTTKDCPLTFSPLLFTGPTLVQPWALSKPLNIFLNFSIIICLGRFHACFHAQS